MLARLGITAGSGTLFLQYFTPQYTSPPPLPAWAVALGLDWRAIATLVAVAAGEVAYWLVRAPTEVQKTRAQLSALVLDGEEDAAAGGGGASSERGARGADGEGGAGGEGGEGGAGGEGGGAGGGLASRAASRLASALSVFDAYPLLALCDLPTVVLRVYFFLLLRLAGGADYLVGLDSLTADLLLYTAASVAANGLTTPLEVVRTRLLLQRSGSSATQYAGITDALATIYREEGAAALFRGLPVRLAWNGLWVGAILGVQRAYYADAQTFFLTVVGEAAEALARPLRSSVF